LNRPDRSDGVVSGRDREPKQPAPPKLPPRLAERYRDLELLGQGGMGQVYRAYDAVVKRPVAMKFIRPDGVARSETLARFHREILLLSRIEHPAVVRIFDVEREAACWFYTMEVVEGRHLADRVRTGPMAQSEAVPLFAALARGLEAVHEQGVLHRDIKPQNIVVGDDGAGRLMDFGLATLADASALTAITKTGTVMGTALYIPPELIVGQASDRRSDVYQLGLTLHFALVGDVPFLGNDLHVVIARTAATFDAFAGAAGRQVDEGLRNIVARAIALSPDDRYATAADFASALDAWRPGLSVEPPPFRERYAVGDRTAAVSAVTAVRQGRRTAIGAAVSVLVVVGGLVAVLSRIEAPEAAPATNVERPKPVERPPVEERRRAWSALLDDFMAHPSKRANDHRLRRPDDDLDAFWFHERVIARLPELSDGLVAGVTTIEELDRAVVQVVGLVDLAFRLPPPKGGEADLALCRLYERVREVTTSLHATERRTGHTGSFRFNIAFERHDSLLKELLTLLDREKVQGREHPVKLLMAGHLHLRLRHTAEAQLCVDELATRFGGRLHDEPSRCRLWMLSAYDDMRMRVATTGLDWRAVVDLMLLAEGHAAPVVDGLGARLADFPDLHDEPATAVLENLLDTYKQCLAYLLTEVHHDEARRIGAVEGDRILERCAHRGFMPRLHWPMLRRMDALEATELVERWRRRYGQTPVGGG